MVWPHAPLTLPAAEELRGKTDEELSDYDQKAYVAVPEMKPASKQLLVGTITEQMPGAVGSRPRNNDNTDVGKRIGRTGHSQLDREDRRTTI